MVALSSSIIELVNAIIKKVGYITPGVAVNLCPIWGWSIEVKRTEDPFCRLGAKTAHPHNVPAKNDVSRLTSSYRKYRGLRTTRV